MPTEPSEVSLGIDVGGTNIKWVALDGSAARLGSGTVATPTTDESSVVNVLEQIVTAVGDRFDVCSLWNQDRLVDAGAVLGEPAVP